MGYRWCYMFQIREVKHIYLPPTGNNISINKTIKMSETESNPDHWKFFGMFYYNTNDKRLWVPKKNPVFGITVNFAKPGAYIFLLILIFFVVLFVKFIP